MAGAKEAAASVFERIRRRREASPDASQSDDPPSAAPVASAASAQPVDPLPEKLRVDEWLEPQEPGTATRRQGSNPRRAGGAAETASVFPRSATMRLVLKHPAMALGVGVPAAALLLSSPGARRILAAVALRAGARPELQQLLNTSAAAIQLSRTLREKP